MLNAGEIIGLMQHALGKVPDSRHNLWATLNRAGRALYLESDWGFRTQAFSLPAVANQAYIELPDDWGGILDVSIPAVGTFTYIQQTSLRDILALRANATLGSITGVVRVFFPMWSGQASIEDQPTSRAELYPTPSVAAQPTLTGYYTRVWKNIAYDPVLNTGDNEAIPNLPDEFEQALVSKARGLAWSTENQQPSIDDTLYAAELQRLKLDDEGAQKDFGRPRGGASSRLWDAALPSRYPARATL